MIISLSLSQNPQALLEESLRKSGALDQVSVRVIQMINDPELKPILSELGGRVPAVQVCVCSSILCILRPFNVFTKLQIS